MAKLKAVQIALPDADLVEKRRRKMQNAFLLDQDGKYDPIRELDKVGGRALQNLYPYVRGAKMFVGNRLSVSCRPDGTWLGVLVFQDAETLKEMVAFGSGETFWGAVVGLSKALAAARARENRPFVAR